MIIFSFIFIVHMIWTEEIFRKWIIFSMEYKRNSKLVSWIILKIPHPWFIDLLTLYYKFYFQKKKHIVSTHAIINKISMIFYFSKRNKKKKRTNSQGVTYISNNFFWFPKWIELKNKKFSYFMKNENKCKSFKSIEKCFLLRFIDVKMSSFLSHRILSFYPFSYINKENSLSFTCSK